VLEESKPLVVEDEHPEEEISNEPHPADPAASPPTEQSPVIASEPEPRRHVFLLHHPSNDKPADPDSDAFLFKNIDPTRPICNFFQHSVLGDDFGESTFPRVSYTSSEALPYRVHYASDDDLHYESYRWPFAACNHACELQALKIRGMFDWELHPDNQDGAFDEETKEALSLAREICEWKNAHYHFAITDLTDFVSPRGLRLPRAIPEDIAPTNGTSDNQPDSAVTVQLFNSPGAQAAMNEIEGIFRANKGPQDIAAMFHTVIRACQIHRYATTPMTELVIGQPAEYMVQQAMSQIGRVFAETQDQIPVWETRDAIVRATQIYRFQEENGL
jgi:hypothetical protein